VRPIRVLEPPPSLTENVGEDEYSDAPVFANRGGAPKGAMPLRTASSLIPSAFTRRTSGDEIVDRYRVVEASDARHADPPMAELAAPRVAVDAA
jgi:hypothetical protein